MQAIKNLKQQLQRGDYQLIAERTGVNSETVRSIFCERRSAETDSGKAVVKAAQALIRLRKKYFMATAHA